jgi:hypothetical protein
MTILAVRALFADAEEVQDVWRRYQQRERRRKMRVTEECQSCINNAQGSRRAK